MFPFQYTTIYPPFITLNLISTDKPEIYGVSNKLRVCFQIYMLETRYTAHPDSWDNKGLSKGQDTTDGIWLTRDHLQPLLLAPLFPMPVHKLFFSGVDGDRYVLAEVEETSWG